MAPPGLIISKLGVQASASSQTITGLICLKVSINRENAQSRYALFPGTPPKITSHPAVHSIPLSKTSVPSEHYAVASSLLNLGISYPPSPYSSGGSKPTLEVSSTTGQVFLVLDSGSKRPSSPYGTHGTRETKSGGRREWVVIIEFEVGVERSAGGGLRASIPTPKCLDNVIRFQIHSPHASSSSNPDGEVTISTEPKVLPLPPSTFAPPKKHLPGDRLIPTVRDDEGWEDGEDLGPDDLSEDADDEEEEGDWLEGRFQSTDNLRLNWSFGGPSASIASLHVIPQWDDRIPTISVRYESVVFNDGLGVSLEACIPDGWGWSTLDIHGDDLISWKSTDADLQQTASTVSRYQSHQDDGGADDSFATVRAKRTRSPLSHTYTSPTPQYSSSVSLLRQTLPGQLDMKMEDFSFEMNSMDDLPTPRPTTPIRKPPTLRLPAQQILQLLNPVEARSFDFEFRKADTTSFILEGTLVPISHLHLVSPGLPIAMPFFRLEGGESTCAISCPGGSTPQGEPLISSMCDVRADDIGAFTWMDPHGLPIPSPSPVPIKGDVTVRLKRNAWGLISMTIVLTWPKRATEVGFDLPEASTARVIRAVRGTSPLPRAIVDCHDGKRVILGSAGKGETATVLLEVQAEGDGVPLPRFDGTGSLQVELQGRGWRVTSNMSQERPGQYTLDLAKPATMSFRPDSLGGGDVEKGKLKNLLSWNAFFNLFILWLLISMAQQVQRLRNEVAFVAEETRDLRLYGLSTTLTTTISPTPAPTGSPGALDFDGQHQQQGGSAGREVAMAVGAQSDMSTAIGRVVFGRSAWEKWTHHPTVRTFGRGLGWVWQAVVWLVAPG